MSDKKPIDKEYLLTQLKNLDSDILEEKYLNQEQIWEGTQEELELVKDELKDDTLIIVNNDKLNVGIPIDMELDVESTNPISNHAVASVIDELKNSVSDGKVKVADAITARGVETATDATFEVMAENIGKISSDTKHSVYLSIKYKNTPGDLPGYQFTGTIYVDGVATVSATGYTDMTPHNVSSSTIYV